MRIYRARFVLMVLHVLDWYVIENEPNESPGLFKSPLDYQSGTSKGRGVHLMMR